MRSLLCPRRLCWGAAKIVVLGLVLLMGHAQGADDAVLKDRLSKSAAAIKASLKTLRERWDVDHYPNFLASAAMTHSAWELMKVKFQKKILQAHMDGRKSSFVISFMGSSVTAGHGEQMGFLKGKSRSFY